MGSFFVEAGGDDDDESARAVRDGEERRGTKARES